MNWQPFATAPKDGSPILACDGLSQVVIWWGDKNAADSEWGTVAHTPNWLWLISDGHNDPIHYRGWVHLTHWMPLPHYPSPALPK